MAELDNKQFYSESNKKKPTTTTVDKRITRLSLSPTWQERSKIYKDIEFDPSPPSKRFCLMNLTSRRSEDDEVYTDSEETISEKSKINKYRINLTKRGPTKRLDFTAINYGHNSHSITTMDIFDSPMEQHTHSEEMFTKYFAAQVKCTDEHDHQTAVSEKETITSTSSAVVDEEDSSTTTVVQKKRRKKARLASSRKKRRNISKPLTDQTVKLNAVSCSGNSETMDSQNKSPVDPQEHVSISEMPFQDLMRKPDLFRAACQGHEEAQINIVKDNNGGNSRRVQQPRNANNDNVQTKLANGQVQIPTIGNNDEQTGSTTSNEHNKTLSKDIGHEMLNLLLNRFKAGMKQIRPPRSRAMKVLSDNDDSDLDESILDDDFEEALRGGSNLLEGSIPQYHLKRQLCEMHFEQIRNLDNIEIDRVCNDVFEELDSIKKEKIFSLRHQTFKQLHTFREDLKRSTISAPFDDRFRYRITTGIQSQLYSPNEDILDKNAEILNYITLVLLPEALIRIYSKVNKINLDLAEKELRFNAAYDGELPPDIIKTIPTDAARSSNSI